MAHFDFTESQLQELDDWSENIDFDCLDAIENSIAEVEVEPHAKRRRTSGDLEPIAQVLPSCWSPVQFNCSGKPCRNIEKEAVNADGYLATGVFQRLLQGCEPYPEMYNEPVMRQFGAKFVTSNALLHHMEKLFFFLRQQVFRLQMRQNESFESHSTCQELRKTCGNFLAYINTFIHRFQVNSQPNIPRHSNVEKLLLMRLPKELNALFEFTTRLSDLPSASYLRSDVVGTIGPTRLPAASHFFHLNLDLIWNCTLAFYALLEKEGVKTGEYSDCVDYRDILTSLKTAMVTLLWDLVKVAVVQFNKVADSELSKVLSFPCCCVREVWIMLRILLDCLANKSLEIESFWSFLSSILTEVLTPENKPVSDSQESVVTLKAPESFICREPVSFCWWLLSQLAPLYYYNETGTFCQRKRGCVPGNWVFAQDLLKSSLIQLKDGHGELKRRLYLRWVLSLSQHWSANSDLILYLWDYFHKRMNDSFYVTGQSLQSLTIESNSPIQWMERCLNRCGQDCSNPLENEHSFHLFLRVVCCHLVKLLNTGSLQAWKPIKGRFYSKFHKRRMEELNDTGLHHFISLFLSLACVAELEDVANKMCSFLDLLDFKIIQPSKRLLIWKGLFAMLFIYKKKNVELGYLAEKLSKEFTLVTREFSRLSSQEKSRQRQLWDIISLYLDSTLEVFKHKKKQNLSESKLLGEGFGYLLSSCRDNELRKSLNIVESILSTTSPSASNAKETKHLFQEAQSALWTNIFPSVQKLTADQHVTYNLPSHVADVLGGFALLALDRQNQDGTSNQPGVSFTSIVQEYGTRDDVSCSVSCDLLCHVLSSPQAAAILSNENQEESIVHTWFRCMLQLPLSSFRPALHFTRLVCKLREMEVITKLQPNLVCCDCRETALQMFVTALGQHYLSLTTYSEMVNFRHKALVYFGDVLKYFEPVLVNAAPSEHLKLCYHVAASLVKYCAKIIYSKMQPHCLLPRILDQLVIPLVNTKKPIPAPMVQYTKVYLQQFIQGLASLDFRRDDFLRRKIKQIFERYFHQLNQKYLSSQTGGILAKHPCLVALKDSFSSNPSVEASDFRQFVLEIIRETHLQLPQPPGNLTPTLFFIQHLLRKTQSHKINARNAQLLIQPMMECLLACTSYKPELPGVKRQVTEILQLLTEGCKKCTETNWREELLPLLRDFMRANLPTFQGSLFKAFETLGTLDPDLVKQLIPAANMAISESEQKRGVGTDTVLRSSLTSLVEVINTSKPS